MTVREALAEVYGRHGHLTPSIVLAEARGDDEVAATLRPRFEWDDAEAGERWRLTQAASLIREYRIVYRPSPRSALRDVRQYVSVPDPAVGRVYRATEEVAADPLMAQILLREAERAWRELRARYGALEGFIRMVQADLGEQDAA